MLCTEANTALGLIRAVMRVCVVFAQLSTTVHNCGRASVFIVMMSAVRMWLSHSLGRELPYLLMHQGVYLMIAAMSFGAWARLGAWKVRPCIVWQRTSSDKACTLGAARRMAACTLSGPACCAQECVQIAALRLQKGFVRLSRRESLLCLPLTCLRADLHVPCPSLPLHRLRIHQSVRPERTACVVRWRIWWRRRILRCVHVCPYLPGMWSLRGTCS